MSYPVTDSGDDGVQVLEFKFQQHNPGTLSTVRVRMVKHHIEEVLELVSDAGILKKKTKKQTNMSQHIKAV